MKSLEVQHLSNVKAFCAYYNPYIKGALVFQHPIVYRTAPCMKNGMSAIGLTFWVMGVHSFFFLRSRRDIVKDVYGPVEKPNHVLSYVHCMYQKQIFDMLEELPRMFLQANPIRIISKLGTKKISVYPIKERFKILVINNQSISN